MRSNAHVLLAAVGRVLAQHHARNGAYPTIAVDGRGASGKTSLAGELGRALPDITVINGDDYFEPHDDPITWGAFNEERFAEDVLRPLRAGLREIPLRAYSFSRGRVEDAPPLSVTTAVIVERCFSFALDVPWDLRVWVDAPADVCLARGLRRDSSPALGERVDRAWREVWQPREDRYIAALDPRGLADVVVPGA